MIAQWSYPPSAWGVRSQRLAHEQEDPLSLEEEHRLTQGDASPGHGGLDDSQVWPPPVPELPHARLITAADLGSRPLCDGRAQCAGSAVRTLPGTRPQVNLLS